MALGFPRHWACDLIKELEQVNGEIKQAAADEDLEKLQELKQRREELSLEILKCEIEEAEAELEEMQEAHEAKAVLIDAAAHTYNRAISRRGQAAEELRQAKRAADVANRLYEAAVYEREQSQNTLTERQSSIDARKELLRKMTAGDIPAVPSQR